MELRHLRYFLTVADELHFGRAAEKLFMAQPPLSRQIKLLEEELGVELFNRTKKSVQLTPYGKYLREEAVKIFRQMEIMKNRLDLLKEGVVGQIKIGYVGSAMHSLLPEVLSILKQEYSEIDTFLSELDNDGQIEALRNGNIDVGFVRPPIKADDIFIKPICSETFCLIVPFSHPLAKSNKITLEQLTDEPFVSFCRQCGPALFDKTISICNRAGFFPKIVHETSQINSLVRLVESNMGYSIVPTGVKSGYNLRVKFFELDQFPERAELALAYNPKHLSATTKKIIELISDYTSRSSEVLRKDKGRVSRVGVAQGNAL
jgi:DNA-binding transcriptional LysR family regulator